MATDMRAMRLVAKVKAVNRAHEYAHKLYAQLVPIFKPLVGQKILKADGTLLAKYDKLLPELPCFGNLRVYRHKSDYSLGWTISTDETDSPHTCLYYDVTVYIGRLSRGVLESIEEPFNGRTDYTVEEVDQKRAAYTEAQKVADACKSALHPFGMIDC